MAVSNFIQFDDSKMPSGNDPRTISAWINLRKLLLAIILDQLSNGEQTRYLKDAVYL